MKGCLARMDVEVQVGGREGDLKIMAKPVVILQNTRLNIVQILRFALLLKQVTQDLWVWALPVRAGLAVDQKKAMSSVCFFA